MCLNLNSSTENYLIHLMFSFLTGESEMIKFTSEVNYEDDQGHTIRRSCPCRGLDYK